jgi:hypothetical protein
MNNYDEEVATEKSNQVFANFIPGIRYLSTVS